MSWSQTTLVVDAQDVEKLSDMLEGFLAQAITCENAGADEFYEVAFPGTPDWQKVKLTALFNDTVDLAPIIEFVQNQFTSSTNTEIPVTVAKLVDQDWERVWLSSFKPIQVGTNLWVCPSWCEPLAPNARNIVLDPGLAFGTGTHATTNMCLSWLADQNLKHQRVLDYGSGSGILAIAALMSGAKHADAVDIDPLAVSACAENAERNKVEQQLNAYLTSELPSEITASYDLVIANILAEVIIELRDTLLQHLRPGGTLLLTGILSTQAEKVQTAFGPGFQFSQNNSDHWCLLTARRR